MREKTFWITVFIVLKVIMIISIVMVTVTMFCALLEYYIPTNAILVVAALLAISAVSYAKDWEG